MNVSIPCQYCTNSGHFVASFKNNISIVNPFEKKTITAAMKILGSHSFTWQLIVHCPGCIKIKDTINSSISRTHFCRQVSNAMYNTKLIIISNGVSQVQFRFN